MFAFGISTLAMRYLLPKPIARDADRKKCRISLALLTIAGIIFRSELAIFIATHTTFLFLTGRATLRRDIIRAGLIGVIIGLTATVVVDSFFWQSFPLWPELAAFKFNVLFGQASAWGTHPWHFYFTNALPRLLLNPLTYLLGIPISLLQSSTRISATSIFLPSLAFVAIYSIQPHKEWRFIIYTIPSLTAASALGASYIWIRRAKSIIYRLLSTALVLSTLASFALSALVLLPASAANYPGAHALRILQRIDSTPDLNIYMGNLACQTGVTRFLEQPPNTNTNMPFQSWIYDKTEDEGLKAAGPSFWSRFDYVLVEPGEEEDQVRAGIEDRAWEVVRVVDGFAGVKVIRPGEGAEGVVEKSVLSWVVGERADGVWDWVSEIARSFTRGWWAEVRMEPRVKILRRMR